MGRIGVSGGVYGGYRGCLVGVYGIYGGYRGCLEGAYGTCEAYRGCLEGYMGHIGGSGGGIWYIWGCLEGCMGNTGAIGGVWRGIGVLGGASGGFRGAWEHIDSMGYIGVGAIEGCGGI